MTIPPIRYCPYCGASILKVIQGVPRCMECRKVFLIHYSRQLRAAPRKTIGIPPDEVVPY